MAACKMGPIVCELTCTGPAQQQASRFRAGSWLAAQWLGHLCCAAQIRARGFGGWHAACGRASQPEISEAGGHWALPGLGVPRYWARAPPLTIHPASPCISSPGLRQPSSDGASVLRTPYLRSINVQNKDVQLTGYAPDRIQFQITRLDSARAPHQPPSLRKSTSK